jgi:hypothetical protein
MPLDLLIVVVLRTLVEVAGMCLIAQGILHVLAGKRRERNIVYLFFRLVTSPVVRLTRWITPRVVLDGHIPFLAFVLLFWLWIALAVIKRHLCELHQLAC